jgi:putative nucleotidyltransferase with HDIG domain
VSVVKQILSQVDHLPAAPRVAQQVLQLVSDPNFSFKALMETVRLDPGVTAHVLRMCNSPYYGLRRKVSSLQEALTYLGTNAVVDIVLTSQVVGVYKKSHDGYRLASGELWRHSMAVALMAQSLGEKRKYKEVPTLFTAALLHDVGKLILSQYVKEEFSRIEKLVTEEGKSFVEAEREVLGVDHALLGALVARHWNFPEPIARAIAFHHAPEITTEDRLLTSLVALSNLLVTTVGVGRGAVGLAVPMPAGLLKELNLKSRDVAELLLEVKDIIDNAEDLLSLAQ